MQTIQYPIFDRLSKLIVSLLHEETSEIGKNILLYATQFDCKVTSRTLSLFDTSDFTRGVYLKQQINYDNQYLIHQAYICINSVQTINIDKQKLNI